jgi:hypothetical protein
MRQRAIGLSASLQSCANTTDSTKPSGFARSDRSGAGAVVTGAGVRRLKRRSAWPRRVSGAASPPHAPTGRSMAAPQGAVNVELECRRPFGARGRGIGQAGEEIPRSNGAARPIATGCPRQVALPTPPALRRTPRSASPIAVERDSHRRANGLGRRRHLRAVVSRDAMCLRRAGAGSRCFASGHGDRPRLEPTPQPRRNSRTTGGRMGWFTGAVAHGVRGLRIGRRGRARRR